jgi:hypothetical protein
MEGQNDTNQQTGLITAKEAKALFKQAGLSTATFYRYVQSGQIESVLPIGRQRGAKYPRNQVLAALGKHSITSSTFQQATPADMPEISVLLETFYSAKISVEKRTAWIERNPQVAYILRHDSKLIGCAFIMPLSEEKIIEILSNQIKPPTRPHEIDLYEAGKHYQLYSRATGVLQSVSKKQRRHWAARLIAGLIAVVLELGRNGIYIDRIYAQGDTKAGEHALRSLGFTQIDINAPTNRKNFVLDIPKSGSAFAMKYKESLNTWRAQNEEEA